MQSGSDLQARERRASLCGDGFTLLGCLRFHLALPPPGGGDWETRMLCELKGLNHLLWMVGLPLA